MLLRKKNGLDIYGDALEYLLFYNSVEPMKNDGFSWFASVFDLVQMCDNNRPFLGKVTEEEDFKLIALFIKSELAPITPVAICVNPYMTERDIIDFVKKTYKTAIEPIQERYRKKHLLKLKGSRTKSKKKQTRNEFIYRNRHLPISQLSSLVASSYGKVLDQTYIQTIIRKEEEKRK